MTDVVFQVFRNSRAKDRPLAFQSDGMQKRLKELENVIGCKLSELVAMTDLKQSRGIPNRHTVDNSQVKQLSQL